MSSTVPDAESPGPDRPDPAGPSRPPGAPGAPGAPGGSGASAAAVRGRHRATLEESGWTMPLVALGVLSIVLGVLVLAWPGVTLLVVAIAFGIELVVAGALRISTSRLLPSEPAWLKPVSLALGALSVVAGIICLLRPGTSLLVVAIVIAAGWLSEGVAAVTQGLRSGRSAPARTFLVVSGVVSVLAGLVVAIFPGSSLVLLARLAGIMLVLIGVAELVTAFMARRAGTPGASTPRPAPA